MEDIHKTGYGDAVAQRPVPGGVGGAGDLRPAVREPLKPFALDGHEPPDIQPLHRWIQDKIRGAFLFCGFNPHALLASKLTNAVFVRRGEGIPHFLGNTDYFKKIRNISPLPMIRKDFIIDPYQIYEAKVIGADCILLIAAILSDEQMAEYYKLATELGMDVLVETHDEEEMGRALKIQPKIIGVNNRNLKDFTISLENTKRLRPMVPEGTVFVSESGVTTNEHIAFLKECKVDALLIGGAFMLSEHPRELATEWKNLYNEK